MHAALGEQSLIGSVAYSMARWGRRVHSTYGPSLGAWYGAAVLIFMFEALIGFTALVVYFGLAGLEYQLFSDIPIACEKCRVGLFPYT